MSGDKINVNLSRWLEEDGPEGDIVLSSRIRLARNIRGISYPNNADEEELNQVIDLAKEAAEDYSEDHLHYLNINEMPEVERGLLVEKNLISPRLTKEGIIKGLLINDDEYISIMINEEDHLRLQVLMAGLQLDSAWETADNLDDVIEGKLDFAFSEKWGYLSACPTNLGTGLRASVMVHLPALNITDNINKMLDAVSKLGLVVRGIYGEGSDSIGDIYQISNQITLGSSEKDIIDNLKSVTTQVIEQERQARRRLINKDEVELRDKIQRAYGVLKHCYKISSKEAMQLLSNVKLGIDMGIIDNVDSGLLSKLTVLIRPSHLQKYFNKELDSMERDVKRASLIQTRLNKEE